MTAPEPVSATAWSPAEAAEVAAMLAPSTVRWWLSGGAALDRWRGRRIRVRPNIDVSVVAADLPSFVSSLPEGFTAWATSDAVGHVIRFADQADDVDPQPLLLRDERRGVWIAQVNVEDGTPHSWIYKRDPRLALPWDRAVIDLDGVPTGAPEIQLVWKALRPRPEDDVDRDAVIGSLDEDARAWYERAILTIHPHSAWSIRLRSPFAPAKASWNRPPRL